MLNRCACSLLAVLVASAVVVSRPREVEAQATTPSLPGAPQPTPSYPGGPHPPFGAQGGSGSYSISAAANEHAAFLWVVDNIQHAVMLCEKADTRDFTCIKKPLP
jgi:hypothetical protein